MKKWMFLILAGVAWSQPPSVTPIPSCSGMAAWEPERYLVVHDAKDQETSPRLGLIETRRGCRYQSLEVDWNDRDLPNDLESIAPVAGETDQFLAVESGYFRRQSLRIFWLQAQRSGEVVRWKSAATLEMPRPVQEIEGAATYAFPGGERLLLLGGRGGREGSAGRIFWAWIEAGRKQLRWTKEGLQGIEFRSPRRLGPYGRDLSDMYVDDQGRLWVSACTSPGSSGPFRSLIYLAGRVQSNPKEPIHLIESSPTVWWVDGCKIEGLAPCSRAGYGPAYATDDDDLGGIWRAVPATSSLAY